MSKHYIYATSRDSNTPIYSEEEISGYFFWLDGVQKYLRKKDMANAYQTGDTYVTYRSNELPMTECTWQPSVNNEWYLKSKPNDTSKDNLLSLDVLPEPEK